jgi:hypothetical protein
VGPRASLDDVEGRKILSPATDRTPVVQLVTWSLYLMSYDDSSFKMVTTTIHRLHTVTKETNNNINNVDHVF